MLWLDRLAADVLAPLAVWVFASSLDDLLLDVAFFFVWCRTWFRRRRACVQSPEPPSPRLELTIAILVPCWAEQDVIECMLEHNLHAIEDSNYEIWLGVYPNDAATRAKAAACRARFPRVHYVVCPHDGPTTKADCLNWIYQGLLQEEAEAGKRYEIILQHDAEDLIHPRSLQDIRRYCARFEMVQVPVLPLQTAPHEVTHGSYCDFFAEFHLKELPLRSELGGFLPSAGVGTAYRREALERLRAANGGQVFDPTSLTEDYNIGLELHRLKATQTLLRASRRRPRIIQGTPGRKRPDVRRERIATRAYFPRSFGAAIRQRTRWVMGISLQSWQKFGWRAGKGQLYWLWRDRKGLIGHPSSLLVNLIFGYGLMTALWAAGSGGAWRFGALVSSSDWMLWLLGLNSVLLVWGQLVRAAFVWKAYGPWQAATVPLRAPWTNLINCCATLRALWTFAVAGLRGRTLRWTKTRHFYPAPEDSNVQKPRLGEVLVAARKLTEREVLQALERRGWGERLGEYLVRRGRLSEEELYRALSLQHGLPFRSLDAGGIERAALQMLPHLAAVAMRIVPFRLEGSGRLWIASPELPNRLLRKTLACLGPLELSFVLVTPSNYTRLAREIPLLAAPPKVLRAHAGG